MGLHSSCSSNATLVPARLPWQHTGLHYTAGPRNKALLAADFAHSLQED